MLQPRHPSRRRGFTQPSIHRVYAADGPVGLPAQPSTCAPERAAAPLHVSAALSTIRLPGANVQPLEQFQDVWHSEAFRLAARLLAGCKVNYGSLSAVAPCPSPLDCVATVPSLRLVWTVLQAPRRSAAEPLASAPMLECGAVAAAVGCLRSLRADCSSCMIAEGR